MNEQSLILAMDQGTSSSRAIVFDTHSNILAVSQQEYTQHYPHNGWVEHKPEDIWQSSLKTAQRAIAEAEASSHGKVRAIGITNQRETSLVWDRQSGKAIHNAIVWQDRRTADYCAALKNQGAEESLHQKTGLLLDPYFSASKINWLLQNVDGARQLAENGKLAFGTVDSFLIHRLTGGRKHLTDATNASRTALYNINNGEWDEDLLELFEIPKNMLPEVMDCAANFGVTDAALFGREIPILGVAGDQHAASIGQCCFNGGDIKSTYGTGCFLMMNTGEKLVRSHNRMLSTIAYQYKGKVSYALEGSIFNAGTAIQWLRDDLGLIKSAGDCEAMAESLDDNGGVYLVSAFTGLGAPYWNPEARGAISGLTRATSPAHFVRAALEGVCYQTLDLLEAMKSDGCEMSRVRVDGGMVANNWFNQFLADTLDVTVDRPEILETTALGAAYLAGVQAGLFEDFTALSAQWRLNKSFEPAMPEKQRNKNLRGWKNAVCRVMENNMGSTNTGQ